MPKKASKNNINKIRNLLAEENEFITNLLAVYDVPDSIHGKYSYIFKNA